MPVTNPQKSLAFRDLKNEPCPQSWKMIKARTTKPAASMTSGIVSQTETFMLRYMRYQQPA